MYGSGGNFKLKKSALLNLIAIDLPLCYNLSQKSEIAFFISLHKDLILSINSNIFSPFN